VVVAGVNPTYQAKIRRSLPALTHKTVLNKALETQMNAEKATQMKKEVKIS